MLHEQCTANASEIASLRLETHEHLQVAGNSILLECGYQCSECRSERYLHGIVHTACEGDSRASIGLQHATIEVGIRWTCSFKLSGLEFTTSTNTRIGPESLDRTAHNLETLSHRY